MALYRKSLPAPGIDEYLSPGEVKLYGKYIYSCIYSVIKKGLFDSYVQGIWEGYKNELGVPPAHEELTVMLWKISQLPKWLQGKNITKKFKFSVNEDKIVPSGVSC